MPDSPTPVVVLAVPPEGVDKCAWAQEGLRRAEEGMGSTSGGVKGYHIGTRGLEYAKAGDQLEIVAWWQKQVEYYCGIPAPPAELMGRDSAVRVIPRDV
jgi:hypothetical protein